MRIALLLFALSSQAATLTIDPPVIYDCNGTFGKGTLRWKEASGPVQLVVGPSRVVFTGFGDTSGSADTGTWVGDGLEFRLVNARGAVEAIAVAHVACSRGPTAANGMVTDSYFPLETGNTWVYKTDSRFATSDYTIWTVTGLQAAGGRVYSQITATVGTNSSVALALREEAGMIYRFTGTEAQPREDVYLNPAAGQPTPFRNALGSYPLSVSQTLQPGLTREAQTFVRGVGLVRSRSDLLTGSSGGFSSSMELVDFHLATGPRVDAPVIPRISLSVEGLLLDVSGRLLTNCAIPCYFAACGLGSPVDPVGTYKPCARTRLEAAAEGDFQLDLSLTGSGGEVYRAPSLTGSGEAVRYVQLPLYGEGNKLFPSGKYILTARMRNSKLELGQAQVAVEIR